MHFLERDDGLLSDFVVGASQVDERAFVRQILKVDLPLQNNLAVQRDGNVRIFRSTQLQFAPSQSIRDLVLAQPVIRLKRSGNKNFRWRADYYTDGNNSLL